MSELTVENYLIGLNNLLYVVTDFCLSADALAEWIEEGCRKKPDNGRNFKKITKEIKKFLDGKQVYYRKKIEALEAIQEAILGEKIQGEKRLEKEFEIAMKILESGTSEVKIENFIVTYNDLLRTTTDLCLKADVLIEWIKDGCRKKPDGDRDFKKIVEEIIKFLRGLQAYYSDMVEALETAQESEKLKEEFKTAMEILMDDKIYIKDRKIPNH